MIRFVRFVEPEENWTNTLLSHRICREIIIVQVLMDFLGGHCADLSTSMKFGTDVD